MSWNWEAIRPTQRTYGRSPRLNPGRSHVHLKQTLAAIAGAASTLSAHCQHDSKVVYGRVMAYHEIAGVPIGEVKSVLDKTFGPKTNPGTSGSEVAQWIEQPLLRRSRTFDSSSGRHGTSQTASGCFEG